MWSLGALAVERGLGDVPSISETARVSEALAEHRRDEGGHKESSYQLPDDRVVAELAGGV